MRKTLLVLLTAAIVVALSGCGADTTSDSTDSPATETTSADSSTVTSADQVPMPTDGEGESEALAALDGALAEAKPMRESAGVAWPDLAGVEPALTAYLIAVDMDGQVALFEVRSDGIPHGIYAYQRAFDSGTLIWTPSENSSSPRAQARSAGETAAVAAVDAAMRDSFPDSAFTVSVYGYRFVYAEDGATLLILEVATDGSLISAGS